MAVEVPVFGRKRRLDEVLGNVIQRNGIVMQNAALADLVTGLIET